MWCLEIPGLCFLSTPVVEEFAGAQYRYQVRADTRLPRDDIAADIEGLKTALGRLPPHHSKETVAGWKALAEQGRTLDFAAALIADHYDPAYRRMSARRDRPVIERVEMAEVSPPVGFNLFVIQGLTKRNILWIARAALPFFFLLLAAVMLPYFLSKKGLSFARFSIEESRRTPSSSP